ncbi:MAG: efflux RND transporter periplasmic adaptor subunit [Myxococcaceae bacterium]
MKSRIVIALISLAVLALVGYRIVEFRRTNAKPAEARDEAHLVKVSPVVRAQMPEILSLTGTVRARNEVDIYPKVGGRILTLDAQVGDVVKPNQLLASIEHKEIAWQAQAAGAAVQVAEANLKGARLEYERTQVLFKGGAAPQAQIDGIGVRLALAEAQVAQARAAAGLAHQAVENARVLSPIAGTVIRRPVNLGAQVGPQSPLFTVQDLAALKLEGSVDAAGFARLAKSKEARVRVDALPGALFKGKVSLLSPALDPQTRRAAVELEIDNSERKLLSNMFAHADIVLGLLDDALVIPKEAVLEAAGGSLVYRVKDGQAFAVRPKLGPSDGVRVAVLEGLSEGDEVAVSGLAQLIDGAKVKLATDTAALPGAAALR